MYKNSQQTTIDRQLQTSIMEQTYYVFQDLENVLGVLAETTEVLKHFEGQPNHQMVIDAQNRLIIQINLSNIIQADQSFVKDPMLKKNLKNLKSTAKEYFEDIKKQIPYEDKIDHLADLYVQNNLAEKVVMNQLPTMKSQVTGSFNQQTIQKVLNGMNQVDSVMDDIKSGKKIEIPTKEQFSRKIKERREIAKQKLNQNFKKEKFQNQESKNTYLNKASQQSNCQHPNQSIPSGYYGDSNYPTGSGQQNDPYQHSGQRSNNMPIQPTGSVPYGDSYYPAESSQQNDPNKYTGSSKHNNPNQPTGQRPNNQLIQYTGQRPQDQPNQRLDNKNQNKKTTMEVETQNRDVQENNIIYYLECLHKQIALKNNKNNTIIQIVEKIKTQVPSSVSNPIFTYLEKQLNTSEMSKLFGLIIKTINSNGQQKIDISKIKQYNFLDQHIQFIGEYIDYLKSQQTEY